MQRIDMYVVTIACHIDRILYVLLLIW